MSWTPLLYNLDISSPMQANLYALYVLLAPSADSTRCQRGSHDQYPVALWHVAIAFWTVVRICTESSRVADRILNDTCTGAYARCAPLRHVYMYLRVPNTPHYLQLS
ncbi:hypothetical protein CERSUDRAFT_106105 [Gelatoporia subvermispora B]|uniref:Uncharacterized protein n=1 Tax=Ceriporiopsis subvermispora (strain B) TaxID=914234 RepID=M2PL99_CERS8|nr:hypothetical protein CERSUDRAFT_106105 [Gelatoporia subvermispora B]